MDKQEIFAFVDWGEDELEVGYSVGDEDKLHGERFLRTGKGIEKLRVFLLDAGENCASRVHVGIERANGAVVDTLIDSGFNTYSVNPKQIDRYRGRYRNSSARDDRFDCYVGVRALRYDRECFRLLSSPNPLNMELRGWEREHKSLTEEKSRVAQQIRHHLLMYYPQMLELADLESNWLSQLWHLVPTPEAAALADEREIEAVIKRSRRTASQVLEVLREKPLEVCGGAVRASVGRVRLLFERLGVLLRQIKQVTGELERLLQAIETEQQVSAPERPSDAAIIRSFPGAGVGLVSTLLGEASEQVRARDLENVRAVSGVSPVTDASGKQQNRWKSRRPPLIKMRYACNPRLRDAMHHWGRNAPQNDPYYKEMYDAMRARGLTYGRACRQIADNALSVLFAMLRNGTLYDLTCRKTWNKEEKAAA